MEVQSLIHSSRSNTAVCSNKESIPKPKTMMSKYSILMEGTEKNTKIFIGKNVVGMYVQTDIACRNKLEEKF